MRNGGNKSWRASRKTRRGACYLCAGRNKKFKLFIAGGWKQLAVRRRRSTPRALGARRPGGAGQVMRTESRALPSIHPPIHPPAATRRRQHVDTDGACSERHVEVPRPEGCNRALREWPQGRGRRLPDSRSALAHRKIPPRAHRAGKIMQIHTQPSRFDCFSLWLSRHFSHVQTCKFANSARPPERRRGAVRIFPQPPNRISIIRSAPAVIGLFSRPVFESQEFFVCRLSLRG